MKAKEPSGFWLFMHRCFGPMFIMLNLVCGMAGLINLLWFSHKHPSLLFWHPVMNFAVAGILLLMHNRDERDKGYIEWRRRNGK